MTTESTRPLVAIDTGTSAIRVAFAYATPRERPANDRPAYGPKGPPLMRQGVVNDVPGVASVLAGMMRVGDEPARALAAVGIPSDTSDAERRAIVSAVTQAGAIVGALVPEPLAAAVGAGIDVTAGRPMAIVDIGDGLCDVALVEASTVVGSAALRKGCGDLRQSLRTWFETWHGFEVDAATAESLIRACCASTDAVSWKVALRHGRRRIQVRVSDVAGVIDPTLEEIAQFVAGTLGRFGRTCPPVLLTGGGSNLTRLTGRIAELIELQAHFSPHPAHDVIRGIRQMVRARGLLASFESALASPPS